MECVSARPPRLSRPCVSVVAPVKNGFAGWPRPRGLRLSGPAAALAPPPVGSRPSRRHSSPPQTKAPENLRHARCHRARSPVPKPRRTRARGRRKGAGKEAEKGGVPAGRRLPLTPTQAPRADPAPPDRRRPHSARRGGAHCAAAAASAAAAARSSSSSGDVGDGLPHTGASRDDPPPPPPQWPAPTDATTRGAAGTRAERTDGWRGAGLGAGAGGEAAATAAAAAAGGAADAAGPLRVATGERQRLGGRKCRPSRRAGGRARGATPARAGGQIAAPRPPPAVIAPVDAPFRTQRVSARGCSQNRGRGGRRGCWRPRRRTCGAQLPRDVEEEERSGAAVLAALQADHGLAGARGRREAPRRGAPRQRRARRLTTNVQRGATGGRHRERGVEQGAERLSTWWVSATDGRLRSHPALG